MKIQTLTAAIALSLATVTVNAAPTIYGLVDLSVDYLPENNATKADRDVVDITNNVSFIGVKGSEKLNDRLSAVYQADFGFTADISKIDEQSDFTGRTRFVGLKDEKLGTLRIGFQDTPLKQIGASVDSFNGRMSNNLDINGMMSGESRIGNSIVYLAPDVKLGKGKVNVSVLTATGEASGIQEVSAGYKVAGRGLGDAWSAAATYSQPEFLVGVAYDKAIPSRFLAKGVMNTSDSEIKGLPRVVAAADIVRVVGRVNLKEQGVALKALYQQAEVADKAGNAALANTIDDAKGWLIGAEWKVPSTAFTTKLQYSQNTTSFKDGKADFEAKQLVAGVDYNINKQVSAYGQAGYLTHEQGANKDKQPIASMGVSYRF